MTKICIICNRFKQQTYGQSHGRLLPANFPEKVHELLPTLLLTESVDGLQQIESDEAVIDETLKKM